MASINNHEYLNYLYVLKKEWKLKVIASVFLSGIGETFLFT